MAGSAREGRTGSRRGVAQRPALSKRAKSTDCGYQFAELNYGGNRPDNVMREAVMAESVYKVIELVGTSGESWEKAATAAVERAAQSLRELRIAEVVEQDLQIQDGKVVAYRTKVKLSFRYEGGD